MGSHLWKLSLWAVGRRLICRVKIGGWWFRGPLWGFRFGFSCNGGGERAEEDLIGRTVLAERRMASKVPEGLNIGDLWPFAIPLEILKSKVPNSGQQFWLSSLYWGQVWVQSDSSLRTLRSVKNRGLGFHFMQVTGEWNGLAWPHSKWLATV